MSKGDVLGYYLSRPVSLILIIITVLSVVGPIISELLKKKNVRKNDLGTSS